jgi:hypothetical protein
LRALDLSNPASTAAASIIVVRSKLAARAALMLVNAIPHRE